MTINLPRGKFIQVTGRPTQDNTGRQAQAAQSGAEAFASDGSNIQFGPINPDVLPIATSSSLGVVEPDNVTITVDPSGIISAVVPSGNDYTLPHPGYLTGASYTMPITGVTPKTMANSTLYAHPFFVAKTVTFTKARLRVTGAGGAGSKIRYGIYANDATHACPGALILDFGEVAGDSSSDKDSTINLTLSPGTMYWLVMGANITSGSLAVEGTAGAQNMLMNFWLGSPSTNTTAIGYIATGWTYGVMPDPWPDTTPDPGSSQTPLVFLVP